MDIKGRGGRVVERVGLFGRKNQGSKPPPPFRSLDNFVYPALAFACGCTCLSEETVKLKAVAVGPFYLVSQVSSLKWFTPNSPNLG